jgi:hypothetical protein
MTKFIAFSAMLTMLIVSPAYAGGKFPTLSERFDTCMSNPDCAPSERMNLLVKVSSELQKAAEAMNQNCINKNYRSCIGPKSPGTLQWYKMHSYLAEIADSLEGSGMTEQDLPSLPPEDKKIEQQWPNWYQAERNK